MATLLLQRAAMTTLTKPHSSSQARPSETEGSSTGRDVRLHIWPNDRLFSASPAVGGRLNTRKLLLLRPLPVTVMHCMVQYSARVPAPGTAHEGHSYSVPRALTQSLPTKTSPIPHPGPSHSRCRRRPVLFRAQRPSHKHEGKSQLSKWLWGYILFIICH